MIRIKPNGGLGNRIRAIYSVLSINRKLDYQVKIIWDCSSELNCPFEELFLCPNNCQVRNIEQGLFRKFYRFSLDKLKFSRLRKYRYDLVLYDKNIVKFRKENTDFHDMFKRQSSIYIETCYFFFEGPKITDFLTIHPTIEDEAQVVYKKFGLSTYGIHIRCKDNHASKKYSPPSAFKELVRNKLRKENDAQFFLATDSKKVERDFIDEFNDKIITSGEKELDRNSPEAIKSALVDILCLSKTKKIFGSYGSSFSSIPRLFADVECESVVTESH